MCERSYLIDGHCGLSSTFTAAMKKNAGSGRPAQTGAYLKPLGSVPRQGAVYAVAGSSGSAGTGTLNHPAMFVSLSQLGSMVLDINGNRLDAAFLTETGAVRDSFTISKGSTPTNVAPTVSLTVPAAGSSFAAVSNITLSATAADADGSVSRVDFYAGSTLVGSSTGAPFSLTWPALAAGSYNLTARAADNLGATTTSASVGISVTAPATSTTLIPKRSSWKYLVTPAAPGGA